MNVAECMRMGTQVLVEAGIENARADAEWLLASCFGTRRMQIYLDLHRILDESQHAQFESLLRRRAMREPLQHLLGTAEFFGRCFEVNRFVLIPRPETELLAELGVRHLQRCLEAGREPGMASTRSKRSLSALDFGTGSGCLAITLALEIGGRENSGELDQNRSHESLLPGRDSVEPASDQQGRMAARDDIRARQSLSLPAALFMERRGVVITAIDLSLDAIEVARRNARRHGCEGYVRFFQGDGFSALGLSPTSDEERFDLILANPPYIPSGEIRTLQPEVRDYDPVLALDGGGDGLVFYRRLATEAVGWVTETGVLMAEFGDGQFEAIAALFRKAGWELDEPVRDDTGRLRILIARPVAS